MSYKYRKQRGDEEFQDSWNFTREDEIVKGALRLLNEYLKGQGGPYIQGVLGEELNGSLHLGQHIFKWSFLLPPWEKDSGKPGPSSVNGTPLKGWYECFWGALPSTSEEACQIMVASAHIDNLLTFFSSFSAQAEVEAEQKKEEDQVKEGKKKEIQSLGFKFFRQWGAWRKGDGRTFVEMKEKDASYEKALSLIAEMEQRCKKEEEWFATLTAPKDCSLSLGEYGVTVFYEGGAYPRGLSLKMGEDPQVVLDKLKAKDEEKARQDKAAALRRAGKPIPRHFR